MSWAACTCVALAAFMLVNLPGALAVETQIGSGKGFLVQTDSIVAACCCYLGDREPLSPVCWLRDIESARAYPPRLDDKRGSKSLLY